MAVAGARFESYVKDAMREGEIPSLAELSRRSGIAISAWHGWFRGERQPRRNSLVLAGNALARTPEQLSAVWEGERPHKAARATETPEGVAAAIDRQTDVLRAFLDLLTPWVAGEAELGRRRGDEAAQALRVHEGDVSRAKRSAPPSSTGSGR